MFGTITSLLAITAVTGLGLAGFIHMKRQRAVARILAIHNPNGIAEQRFIRIGGIEQWIQIRGEDRSNPVLLVIHGGPGSPYAAFTLPMRPWEKHFTIVQWDRRGAGKTLGRNGKTGSGEMTFPRMVKDAIEVAEFLRGYLGKAKLVLMAGSMGNMVALPLIKRRPDLFSAFVSTDLYVNMLQNEALSHEQALKRLNAAGNSRGYTALEKIGPDPALWDYRAWTINLQWTFASNLPTPNLDRSLLLPLILTAPFYSLKDVVDWFSGFEFSKSTLFQQIMAYDARSLGPSFEVPFFLFQGDTDVITLTALAQEYFEEIQAPNKEMVLIQQAGHFAAFTQPGQFLDALLTHVRPLAVQVEKGSQTVDMPVSAGAAVR